ncbi:hypothetical protein [Rathayibacter festucae]|uniref:hypothetical protein n=1 Tax=Rathayibacter festucae TaxID=110937 RepID=UPI002A6A2A48|nr:hypothetical protein [Rathayibacter festucae]MDY0912575.1 hypothetical protein [Rathayibacter festucae]
MNDKPVIDPARDRAFRAMVVETARAENAARSPRARASLLVGLVLAALLVSGGGVAVALSGIIPDPLSVPVPSSTPTPSPTPESTTPAPAPVAPVASPSPTPTSAELADWVIGFDGVGPIAFGGTLEAASAALDTTDLLRYDSGIEGCLTDTRNAPGDPSAAITVDPDPTGTTVVLITVSSFVTPDGTQSAAQLPATAAGIGIGSTGAELLAAYPGLGSWETRAGEPGYWLDDDAGHRLWFSVDSSTDLVEAIALSTPERLPFGGCGA